MDKFLQENRWVNGLLNKMTMAEKLGQLAQVSGNEGYVSAELADAIIQGRVGSVINEVDADTVKQLQFIARSKSRLGIPLLIGRDVIHGFKTIFPIPLGQAASWSPHLIEQAAHISALEASRVGINWTFSPMIDISRDPRWGRIAESFGEDPLLNAKLGQAMIRGYQGHDLASKGAIAACAKHFVGYGAAESGRDYNTVNIAENELRNVYFRPFQAAIDANVATFMAAFNDLNGVPASGNQWLMHDVLRQEWQYQGVVVSDWESISQLTTHGFSADASAAACEAVNATIDMEMVSHTYQDYLPQLIQQGQCSHHQLDAMVRRILQLKYDLGLFEQADNGDEPLIEFYQAEHLDIAKQLAQQSCVLLQNHGQVLPLAKQALKSVAVLGPLADDGYEQMGTWVFDGEAEQSQTCLQAIKNYCGNDIKIEFNPVFNTSRSYDTAQIAAACKTAEQADVALVFLGEEAILSGEAHCRTSLGLPGNQQVLLDALATIETPVVLVIMAGRPLVLTSIVDKVDAILYSWHGGTMAGPAIAELLFGIAIPSGKLPATFPRHVGQIPLYYAQKHTGKPATESSFVHMDDIPIRAPQTSLGMAATHLDCHFSPLFSFGFGLSYSHFRYQQLILEREQITRQQTLKVSVIVQNLGDYDACEVIQVYMRDKAANVTRPVKELIDFRRVYIASGATQTVDFEIAPQQLGFYGRDMQFMVEAGEFDLWVGGDSNAALSTRFYLIEG